MDRRKKIFLIVGGVILALILFIAAAYAYVNHKLFGNMASVDFDEKKVENLDLSEEQLAQMKGHWMIACFGVDSREKGGEMNVGKGANADVNMICSVDLESGEIKLVSVFRDTYLNISDKNTYNKINAAYAIGGPEQAVAALNKNLDLNITQYATFNWKAVADAINILGGVDIELSENERSWINAYITETVKETGIGSHQIQKAGLVHMDGVQAVAYGRIRYGDTDYARTERQRIVLQAAFDKVKTADWATVNNVIQTVMPQLATNIDMADLIPLARQLANFHIGDTKGFPMARGEANVGKNGDCVIPQTLVSNVSELHQFLFGTENYQPSSKVQSYSAHISEATGMYKEGKSIDHVPVDQGLNASSYVKAKQKRAAEKAAAEQRAKEEAEAAPRRMRPRRQIRLRPRRRPRITSETGMRKNGTKRTGRTSGTVRTGMRTGATMEFQATEEPQDLEQTPQVRQAVLEIREIQTLEKTDLPSLEAVLRLRRRRAVRPETEVALERLLEAARANRLQGKIPKRAFPVRKQTAR